MEGKLERESRKGSDRSVPEPEPAQRQGRLCHCLRSPHYIEGPLNKTELLFVLHFNFKEKKVKATKLN